MKSKWTWAIALSTAAIIVGVSIYTHRLIEFGLSARDQPTSLEDLVARKLRRAAIPAKAKTLQNPLPSTAEMLIRGRNHWADHCATCHSNNGSGDTMIGKNLYPKTPDMRLPDTQSLTDGELYYIIRNGVRMTGMPAWGSPQDGDLDHDSWMLVLFIRHLPQVTAQEEREMQKLNPKTAADRDEEQQEENFLNGTTSSKENSNAH
jgi:mono/diheme cytochrome c family protein